MQFLLSLLQSVIYRFANGRKGCGINLLPVILTVLWSVLFHPKHVFKFNELIFLGFPKFAKLMRSEGQVLSVFFVNVKRNIVVYIFIGIVGSMNARSKKIKT